MKSKIILLPLFLLFVFLFATSSVFAHSGCCSHHDGVRADGCGCNDGTPLSDICAPYYTCTNPQQTTTTDTTMRTNTYVPPVYVPPTDTPTQIPTDTPIPTITPTPTMKPTPTSTAVRKHSHKQLPTKPKPHKSWWQWLFGW